MMMARAALFFGVTYGTVLAVFHGPGSGQGNVLERMTEGPAPTIANGHFAIDFNNGNFVDQFQRVAAVFAQHVLFIVCMLYACMLFRRGAQDEWRKNATKPNQRKTREKTIVYRTST
jgi:hypothetical protein